MTAKQRTYIQHLLTVSQFSRKRRVLDPHAVRPTQHSVTVQSVDRQIDVLTYLVDATTDDGSTTAVDAGSGSIHYAVIQPFNFDALPSTPCVT